MNNTDTFTIEIPSWCKIGTRIKWYNPDITGHDWVFERIISYGYDGFFHQAHNCPVYFTKFTEYGKTVELAEEYK